MSHNIQKRLENIKKTQPIIWKFDGDEIAITSPGWLNVCRLAANAIARNKKWVDDKESITVVKECYSKLLNVLKHVKEGEVRSELQFLKDIIGCFYSKENTNYSKSNT